MIDMHTHILPNIDDGASNLTEALNMTEYLFRQKVTTAVCTPHFDPTNQTMDDFLEKRRESMDLMKESKINLISGSETILHDLLFQYSDLNQLCINNNKYLLLELPYKDKWTKYDYGMIEKVIRYFNIIPVIAHVERYKPVQKSEKCIRNLIDIGCVIQLNSTAIIHKETRRKAFHYIKKGFIDVLGSDCHNMTTRLPFLVSAFHLINENLGTDYCNDLQYKAESILKGIDFRNITNQIWL